MPFNPDYTSSEPQRSEIDQLAGPAVLEFGSSYCGHCRSATPIIQQAFDGHADVRHIKMEDGSGRPLGRSFRVKLWPTLVFLKDGREVSRLVRPADGREVAKALDAIDSLDPNPPA